MNRAHVKCKSILIVMKPLEASCCENKEQNSSRVVLDKQNRDKYL